MEDKEYMMTRDPLETPTVRKVADRVWVRQAVDVMGWADLDDKVLVVDALEQPREADSVLAALTETTGKPVGWVLNTHTHADHTCLNETFRTHFGAEIINHATRTVPDDGLEITGTHGNAILLPAGGAHTAGDCLVWLPTQRVLFVGDLFGWGLVPPNNAIEPGQAQLIRRLYDRMVAFDADVVVPGHGPTATTDHLRRWRTYFDGVEQQVASRIAAGLHDEDILPQIPPPPDMHDWWRFLKWKHADTVAKVLHACRRGIMGHAH